MLSNPQAFRFNATLERFPGKCRLYHVKFPYVVEELFGTKSAVRVKGTLNGLPIDRALEPLGDGTHYLIINPDLRRQARIALGSKVTIELWRNETPNELELPAELEAALDLEPTDRERFDQLRLSTRRQVAYWVDSAKGLETRANRAAEMLRRLLSGHFAIGGQKS